MVIVLSYLRFVKDRKHIFQTWKKLRIAGPEPNVWTGNILQFYNHPLGFVSKMVQKYGNFSGFYIGPIPVIIVKDREIIKDVLIRKFDNFVNRTKYPLLQMDPMKDSILALRQERWRSVRSVLSPFFTIAKLKKTVNLINKSADIMVSRLDSYEEIAVNIFDPSRRCVVDALLQIVVGRKENVQLKMQHDLFLNLQSFSADMRSSIMKIGYAFPSLMPITNYIARYFSSGKRLSIITSYFERFIELKKRADWTQSNDFLSLMLKHKKEATDGKALTENEILAAVVSFVLVGFDTTASSIAYCLYILSHHSYEQEALFNEIQDVVSEDGNLTYENVMYRMPVLDQIYKETLRMYPPFPVFSTRECEITYEKNGLTIPAGSSVMIPIKELHYDVDIWDEPELFNPSRFAPENARNIPPFAYQPFLEGSRNCIGRVLGVLISKITIAKVVMQYQILPTTEKMQEIPSGITTSAVNYPRSGTNVKLRVRK